ncbi:hypothetical protein ABH941_007759 [Streptacidiphilus sp. EB103A]
MKLADLDRDKDGQYSQVDQWLVAMAGGVSDGG